MNVTRLRNLMLYAEVCEYLKFFDYFTYLNNILLKLKYRFNSYNLFFENEVKLENPI